MKRRRGGTTEVVCKMEEDEGHEFTLLLVRLVALSKVEARPIFTILLPRLELSVQLHASLGDIHSE